MNVWNMEIKRVVVVGDRYRLYNSSRSKTKCCECEAKLFNIVMGNIVEYQNHIIVRNAGKNIAENTNVQLVETIIAMIVKILRNVGREIVKNMIAKVVD